MDHDRNRRRFGKADDELVGYFSAAIGVRAQNVDSNGGGGDLNERHYSLLRQLQRGHLAWHDAVTKTIAKLPAEHRRVIALVYTPHGMPQTRKDDAYWLASALLPPWGGGSLVGLAVTLPRAAEAARGRVDGMTVGEWLASQGIGAIDGLIRRLKDECETHRLEALAAYEVLRKDRVKAEQVAEKERDGARSERNMRLYSELVGRREAKRAARYEARLKRGRAA